MIDRIMACLDRLIVWFRVLAWRRRHAAQYRAAQRTHDRLLTALGFSRWRAYWRGRR